MPRTDDSGDPQRPVGDLSFTIRPLNRDDRDEVRAWHELGTRSVRAARPGFEPRSLDELWASLHSGHRREEHIAVAVAGGRIVGRVGSRPFPGADDDKAFVELCVDPAKRGRGYGTQLAAYLDTTLPLRPTLLAGADFTGDVHAAPSVRFGERHGFHVSWIHVTRELPLPPAGPRPVATLPAGYSLATYVDGIPERLRASYGTLTALVMADSPAREIAWSQEPRSPDYYAEELRRVRDGGGHLVESLLCKDDAVIAFTSAIIPANPKRPLDVEGTYVHRAHRGQGLGLAVKLEMERALLAMNLPNPALRTANDADNAAMIAVNDRLGFTPTVATAMLVRRDQSL